jgi:hypothetical protein
MPHEQAARAEHAREFADDASVISRIEKESEGGKEIDHGVEAPAPRRWKLTHVGAQIFQAWTGASLEREREEIARQIDAPYIIASLSQEMRVSPLPAWNVEYPRADRESHDVDQAGDLAPVLLE